MFDETVTRFALPDLVVCDESLHLVCPSSAFRTLPAVLTATGETASEQVRDAQNCNQDMILPVEMC